VKSIHRVDQLGSYKQHATHASRLRGNGRFQDSVAIDRLRVFEAWAASREKNSWERDGAMRERRQWMVVMAVVSPT
jgi:hypothetical protein